MENEIGNFSESIESKSIVSSRNIINNLVSNIMNNNIEENNNEKLKPNDNEDKNDLFNNLKNNDNDIKEKKNLDDENNLKENNMEILGKINVGSIIKQNDDSILASNNFILSIIKDLKASSQKNGISEMNDDYIKPRKIDFIELEKFKEIFKNISDKESIRKFKKIIDNYDINGMNLGSISSFDNLFIINYGQNIDNLKNENEEIEKYKNTIYRWRLSNWDINNFYRYHIFYYIEQIILERHIQSFINLFNDIYTLSREEYFKQLINVNKIKIENIFSTLSLIYYALNLRDMNSAVLNAYTIFIKCINNDNSFDLGLILYLKYSIYKYLLKNENKLYNKEYPIKINQLLPEIYQEYGKDAFKNFFEKELIPLNKKIERIIIYITPYVLGKTLKIYSFIFQNNKLENLEEILIDPYLNEEKENTNLNKICLLFVNNNYNIIYSKDYYEKHQSIFNKFSDSDLKDIDTTIKKEEEKTQVIQEKVKLNNNNISNNNDDYEILNVIEIENKLLPSQISNIDFNCPSCDTEVKIDFYCDKCHLKILYDFLEREYCNYIKINIANLISMKDIIPYNQFFNRLNKIIYPNNIEKNYNEAINLLSKKFDGDNYIKKIKPNLCLGCFKYISFNENTFLFKLPCKCLFCTQHCFLKFLKAVPFHQMNSFICACGEDYDILKLKTLTNFLNYINLNRIKKDFLRFIYNKIKNKCPKCNCIVNAQNNEECNIIAVNDSEAEKNFNIIQFIHLVCDNCWNNIGNENTKFICETCDSVHLIHKKYTIKKEKIKDNCFIF